MWRQMINDNRVMLVRDLDFRDIRDHLIQDGVLGDHEDEDVRAEKTRHAQVSRMLDILTRKPEIIIEKFWRSMKVANPILYEVLQWSSGDASKPEVCVNTSLRDEGRGDSIDSPYSGNRRSRRRKDKLGLMQSELEDWYLNTLSRLHPVPWCEWLELDLDHVFTNLEVVPARKHNFDFGNHGYPIAALHHTCSEVIGHEAASPVSTLRKAQMGVGEGLFCTCPQLIFGNNSNGIKFTEISANSNVYVDQPSQHETEGQRPSRDKKLYSESALGLIFTAENLRYVESIATVTAKRCISLVEGPAGIGKSTLCRRLVHSWAKNGHRIHGHHFDLALVLEGNALNGSLKECIAQQLFPDDFKLDEEAIYKYIKKCEDGCLLIIDGVDELTTDGKKLLEKILSGGILRHANVLITGRPEATREFVKYVNVHLTLQGFSFDNVEAYVCKYFGSTGERYRNILMDKLRNDFRLQQLATNPFTTLLLCLLVQDYDGNVPSNEVDIYHQVLLATCNNYISKFNIAVQEEQGISSENLLRAAGKVAYEGVKELKVVFPETDICQICLAGLGPHVLKSGLLNRDFTLSRLHCKGCCYFPHKSLQEYMCAHHLASLDITQLRQQLRPLFFEYRFNINMFRFLFHMLRRKEAHFVAVLQHLCWRIAREHYDSFLTVAEQVRWVLLLCVDSGGGISELQCAADSISASDRLSRAFCYGSFYNYWAGKISQCWSLILNEMALKPVVVVHDRRLKLRMGERCDRDICHFFQTEKQLNVTTAVQLPHCRELLVIDPSIENWSEVSENHVWPCIHCKSVKTAQVILKCNTSVDLLAVTLMTGLFTYAELEGLAGVLASITRPVSVLLLILKNPYTDYQSFKITNIFSHLSARSSATVHVHCYLLKPYALNVSERDSMSSEVQQHKKFELETIYVVRQPVQQLYYNRFCPY